MRICGNSWAHSYAGRWFMRLSVTPVTLLHAGRCVLLVVTPGTLTVLVAVLRISVDAWDTLQLVCCVKTPIIVLLGPLTAVRCMRIVWSLYAYKCAPGTSYSWSRVIVLSVDLLGHSYSSSSPGMAISGDSWDTSLQLSLVTLGPLTAGRCMRISVTPGTLLQLVAVAISVTTGTAPYPGASTCVISVTPVDILQLVAAAATQAKKSKSSTFTIEDFRKEPLGADSSDCTYWFLDMWDVGAEEGGVNYGTVLFKEHIQAPINLGGALKLGPANVNPATKKDQGLPPSEQLAQQTVSRAVLKAYRVPEPTGDCAERGSWQQLACSVSELEEVGFKLRRSKKKPDQTTATTRHEMEERLKKARERTAKLLGNSGGGYWGQMEYAGRTMRQRKPVSYNTDDYDKTIRRAIRAAENEEPRDSRPPSAPADWRRFRTASRPSRGSTDVVSAEFPEPSRPAAKEQAVSGGTQPGAATKNGGPVKVASEKLQPGPVGEVLPPQGAADGGGEAEQKLGNGCNKLGNAEHANGSTKALQGGGDEEVPYAATLEAVQCTSQPSQLIQRPIGAKREPQVVIAEAPATVAEAHTVQTEAPVIVAEGPQLDNLKLERRSFHATGAALDADVSDEVSRILRLRPRGACTSNVLHNKTEGQLRPTGKAFTK
eukprot:gene27019-2246_t